MTKHRGYAAKERDDLDAALAEFGNAVSRELRLPQIVEVLDRWLRRHFEHRPRIWRWLNGKPPKP